jgi:HD-GYP domain-containing protein (c-di-GMP phosphodiesterase class II)
MSSAIDARDPYTQGHSERVAKLGYEIAKILGISESACQEIYLAGLLHDLGKIGVPDHILHKAGALTDEEFAVIKQHPEIGHRIIERLGKLHFVLPGVLHHHERWDGKGYPHALKQESIPLMARILAVADSFDAMTSSRPYRGAMPIERAAAVIRDGAGQQWDTAIVDCFEIWLNRTLPAHPVGIPLEAEDLLSNSPPFESISQVVIALNL